MFIPREQDHTRVLSLSSIEWMDTQTYEDWRGSQHFKDQTESIKICAHADVFICSPCNIQASQTLPFSSPEEVMLHPFKGFFPCLLLPFPTD